MSLGKCPSGAGFQVALKSDGFIRIRKRNVGFEEPRPKLGGVRCSSLIMFSQSCLQIAGSTHVSLVWVQLRNDDVDVVHAKSVLDVVGFEPSFAQRAPAGSLRPASSAGLPAEALAKAGGAEGNQTPDLFIANEALYRLSYSPVFQPWEGRFAVEGAGSKPLF